MKTLLAAASAASLFLTTPARAQDAVVPAVTQPEPGVTGCELHVWPTENYVGINTGMLSALGGIGAIIEADANAGKVKTVKGLMRDYLGPEVQMEELSKIGLAETLKLRGYRIVVQEPTPSKEDLKSNPDLKARAKAMEARIKANKRLSDSTNPCYAELITTRIFYYKAAMYGSNLFTGWAFRDFGSKPTAVKVAKGEVKNPLENFPPKSADMVETAKLELRDAFAKDFREYVQKKVKP